MCKKNTYDCVKLIVESKNGILLSAEYLGNKFPLKILCENNHIFETNFNYIVSGNWCKYCMQQNQRLSNEEIVNRISKKGGSVILSSLINYIDTHSIVDVICRTCNNMCKTSLSDIERKKQWCLFCYHGINLKDVIQITRENKTLICNGICEKDKEMHFMCEKYHIFKSTPNKILNSNVLCSICIRPQKHDIEYCKMLAHKHNGLCLSEIYTNNKTKLVWQCEFGHIWDAILKDIIRNHWCPYCGGTKKHTIEECHLIAKENNGFCLENEYINQRISMQWMCKDGHIFNKTFGKVLGGQWCKLCNGISKQQKLLYDILKDIFPTLYIDYNFKGFEWLKFKNGNSQELDIFVYNKDKSFSLAIEYDGIQHFKPVKYFGGKRKFKKQQILDRIKEEKINDHPQDVKHFIRFNYMEKITKEYVIQKLLSKNIKIFN